MAANPASSSPSRSGTEAGAVRSWWRDSVLYEIYPRSFADGRGDGEGDLVGAAERLSYLADLGVDAVWIAPWFPSPMADGGYDVTDYCDIHPLFGTLADAEAFIRTAHARGIRVIIDLVANHTSVEHPWFTEAVAAGPGSPQRERYFFRDGRGDGGHEPPNNWISAFGGTAWKRITELDGTPGQWYLHMFAPEQPDLNWGNGDVQAEFDAILRFWFDHGIDGIRVDAAPAFAKRAGLPDADYGGEERFRSSEWVDNPHWDLDEVHHVLRRWRAIGDEYDGDRMFIAEAVTSSPERLARYLRPDEMHAAFNFAFLKAPWDGGMREVIRDSMSAVAPIEAAPTWVLASHDETRLVTRYGRQHTGSRIGGDERWEPSDLAKGTRRARAAALLLLALPGSVCIYQGQELGLPQVQDIPDDMLRDPLWSLSGHTIRGREGCRVPIPWEGDHPPYGFTQPGRAMWLPQPLNWGPWTVRAQERDPESMLSLYKEAIRIRKEVPGLHGDDLTWREAAEGVLDFVRGGTVRCVVNMSDAPVAVQADHVLIASSPPEDGTLTRDTAAWLHVP